MSTLTPNAARRVLGDLDVNTPIVTSPTKKALTVSHSPSKQKISVTTTISENIPASDLPSLSSSEIVHTGSKKRSIDFVEGSRERSSDERDVQSTKLTAAEAQFPGSTQKNNDKEGSETAGSAGSQEQTFIETQTDDVAPESPRSSYEFSFSQDVGIDSQSTAVTEPEAIEAETDIHADNSAPAPSRVFQPDEARRQAERLRACLQVAMYKIKTNQTDLPLSLLQVRHTNNTRANISATREPSRAVPQSSGLPSSLQNPSPVFARQSSQGMYHGQSKLRDGTTWEYSSRSSSISTSSSDVHIDIEELRRKRARRESEATVKANEGNGSGLQGKAADGLMSLMSMSQGSG